MSAKRTRGYYVRGFSAIGLAVAFTVITDTPTRSGDLRGLIYFVAFGVALATLEAVARRFGWPSRVEGTD